MGAFVLNFGRQLWNGCSKKKKKNGCNSAAYLGECFHIFFSQNRTNCYRAICVISYSILLDHSLVCWLDQSINQPINQSINQSPNPHQYNQSIITIVLRHSTIVIIAQDIWLATVKIGVSLIRFYNISTEGATPITKETLFHKWGAAPEKARSFETWSIKFQTIPAPAN